jgi:hypothetical protein
MAGGLEAQQGGRIGEDGCDLDWLDFRRTEWTAAGKDKVCWVEMVSSNGTVEALSSEAEYLERG